MGYDLWSPNEWKNVTLEVQAPPSETIHSSAVKRCENVEHMENVKCFDTHAEMIADLGTGSVALAHATLTKDGRAPHMRSAPEAVGLAKNGLLANVYCHAPDDMEAVCHSATPGDRVYFLQEWRHLVFFTAGI